MSPDVKVSFDSRYEAAFPTHVFEDTLDFYQEKKNWREALARLGGDAVLVPRYYSIGKAIMTDVPEGWTLAYEDEASILLVREAETARFEYVDRRGEKLSADVL